MSGPRILVAGLGNIFLGDDAFGVEVVRRLAGRPRPAGVRVADFGIRGLDLAYALLEGVDGAILIDAAPRGERPGTLTVIEPELATGEEPGGEAGADLLVNGHGLDPVKVLRLVAALGCQLPRVLVVACEPEPMDPDAEMRMELSEPVKAAVEEAVTLVETLIAGFLNAGESLKGARG
jgi:hydrogenase maturation protease